MNKLAIALVLLTFGGCDQIVTNNLTNVPPEETVSEEEATLLVLSARVSDSRSSIQGVVTGVGATFTLYVNGAPHSQVGPTFDVDLVAGTYAVYVGVNGSASNTVSGLVVES